uniref:Cytochrome b subunit of formate dehydrogenase-like protein n=1 Tax=Solibacter usitatus (strain Ellin6076) TaxID=234267 RepID=Q02BX5_SOLUE
MTNRAYSSFGLSLGSLLLGLFAGISGTPLYAAGTEAPPRCTSCHDQGQKLEKSAHSSLTCDTCHESHDKVPHPANIPKPACVTCHADQAGDYEKGVHGQARKGGNEGAPDCALCHGSAHELLAPKSQAFRTAVPDTCGMCHTDVVTQFRASVHGQALARGITQAPLCTDCHGEHKILKHTNTESSVNNAHIRDTCGSCHGNVRLTKKFGMPSDRLVSFDSSFHGLAAKSGSQTVANCASCHGVHNILPPGDANSMVNAKNLPKTCGQCHPGAGTRFAISQIHVAEGTTEPDALKWVRQFYLLIIPVTIGLMLLHQGGDWIRKLVRLRFQQRVRAARAISPGGSHGHDVRMLPFERVQHAVLALSFLTLVWTGFALKYPDQWWARPLLLMEGRYSMRSLIHRVAAAVFIGVSVTHLISLIVNRKLREHWKEMLPNMNDPREALSNFAYNLGLGDKPPGRSAHSYIEKAEYWAVVWGAIVMIASGTLLWANNLAMKLLPKAWLDISTSVHFYEALLATLAIVVWHFYSIIFDPDVYPLNTAFLTGKSVKKQESTESEKPQAHVAGD